MPRLRFDCGLEMIVPEKVTEYGTCNDSFTRCTTTFRQEGDTLLVDRLFLLKKPVEYITLNLDLAE